MMRHDKYALYNGNEYRFSHTNGVFQLFSENPDDAKKGFAPYDTGIFIKDVDREKIHSAYLVKTHCTYHGHRFQVIKEKSGSLYIHTSDGSLQAPLQLEMSEPFSYEKWVPEGEVNTIWEERRPVYDLPFLTDPIVKIK